MNVEPDACRSLEASLELSDAGVARMLCGPADSHLRLVEKLGGVEISHHAHGLKVKGRGREVELVGNLLGQLERLVRCGRPLLQPDVERAWRVLCQDERTDLGDIFLDTVYVSRNRARVVTPLGRGQKAYIEALRRQDMVFAIGPAGTGKTYLAVAMAVDFLQKQQVRRIVITRPAVEAGERLGFLPGDMVEKVNPYLRPLYDALHDMMDIDQVGRLMERGVLEVAPLAFMRGRTLNDSFVILDEAHNTTSEQMKMFLTRLGYDSKAVITGDVTQVDLPAGRVSGLVEASELLRGIGGISFCHFTELDVVRHPLVSEIIKAYERRERRANGEEVPR